MHAEVSPASYGRLSLRAGTPSRRVGASSGPKRQTHKNEQPRNMRILTLFDGKPPKKGKPLSQGGAPTLPDGSVFMGRTHNCACVCRSLSLSLCLSLSLTLSFPLSLSPLSLSLSPLSRSIYLSIYLFIYLSIYLSIYLYLSLDLSIYPSIYLSIDLSTYLSIHLSIHLSVYLSTYLSISPSLCVCASASTAMSTYIANTFRRVQPEAVRLMRSARRFVSCGSGHAERERGGASHAECNQRRFVSHHTEAPVSILHLFPIPQ